MFGNIYRWDGEVLHIVATHNTLPVFAEALGVHRIVLIQKDGHDGGSY